MAYGSKSIQRETYYNLILGGSLAPGKDDTKKLYGSQLLAYAAALVTCRTDGNGMANYEVVFMAEDIPAEPGFMPILFRHMANLQSQHQAFSPPIAAYGFDAKYLVTKLRLLCVNVIKSKLKPVADIGVATCYSLNCFETANVLMPGAGSASKEEALDMERHWALAGMNLEFNTPKQAAIGSLLKTIQVLLKSRVFNVQVDYANLERTERFEAALKNPTFEGSSSINKTFLSNPLSIWK